MLSASGRRTLEATSSMLTARHTRLMAGIVQIQNIHGVKYSWKVGEIPGKNLPEGEYIGIIAQEVEKEFPELVREDNMGYKALNYDGMVAVLLETIKEQQKEIEELKAEPNKAMQ